MNIFEIRNDDQSILTTNFADATELDIFIDGLTNYEDTIIWIRKYLLHHPSESKNYISLLEMLDYMLERYYEDETVIDAILFNQDRPDEGWYER